MAVSVVVIVEFASSFKSSSLFSFSIFDTGQPVIGFADPLSSA